MEPALKRHESTERDGVPEIAVVLRDHHVAGHD